MFNWFKPRSTQLWSFGVGVQYPVPAWNPRIPNRGTTKLGTQSDGMAGHLESGNNKSTVQHQWQTISTLIIIIMIIIIIITLVVLPSFMVHSLGYPLDPGPRHSKAFQGLQEVADEKHKNDGSNDKHPNGSIQHVFILHHFGGYSRTDHLWMLKVEGANEKDQSAGEVQQTFGPSTHNHGSVRWQCRRWLTSQEFLAIFNAEKKSTQKIQTSWSVFKKMHI